jgi:hypothetical protein
MTFKDFTKIFTNRDEKTYAKLRGTKWAVDALVEIHKASKIQHEAKLTNSSGVPTTHILAILRKIVKLDAYNMESIWVFDNPKAYVEEKKDTMEKRREANKVNREKINKIDVEIKDIQDSFAELTIEEINEIDPDYKETIQQLKTQKSILESRNPSSSQFGQYIRDTKFMLNCLGVRWMQAPKGYDAEQIGAYMAMSGMVDGVKTNDPDCLMYGSPMMLKQIHRKQAFYVYNINDVLAEHDISMNEFIQIGVAMGSDFAEKLKRVGAKTVVKKIRKSTDDSELIRADVITSILKIKRNKQEAGDMKSAKLADKYLEAVNYIYMQDANKLLKDLCRRVNYDYSQVNKVVLPNTIIHWSQKQLRAIQVFQVDPLTEFKINKPKLSAESLTRLENWLINDNDFNSSNTKKILEIYHGKLDKITHNST